MATTIITKNGSGAPLASDLVAGELAVDLTNGRLYTEDSGGSVIELGLTPSGNVDINGGAIDGTTVGAASASTGAFTTLTASSSLNIASSTTVDGVLDEDNMASDSASKLATQQSIKAYVDSQIGANNELSEILVNGNTTGGTDISVSTGDDITFADSSKAIFGAGSDLQIYHDGTNNYVDAAGVGHLYLQSQGDDKDVKIQSDDGSGGLTEYFRADGSLGQAQLYYYGSKKLHTVTGGIDVTGTVTADGLTVQGESYFDTNNGSRALHITRYGTVESESANFTIDDNDLIVDSIQDEQYGGYSFKATRNGVGTANRLTIDNNGDISFYEDTGTTAKLFWDASAESLGIGTTSPATELHVVGSSGDSRITVEAPASQNTWLAFRNTGGADAYLIGYDPSASAFRFYDDVANTERMRITSSGQVGIGTSSPSQPLHISQGANATATAIRIENTDTSIDDEQVANAIEFYTNDVSTGGTGVTGKISHVATNPGSTYGLALSTYDATSLNEVMRLMPNGNVGIGTSSPADILDISNGWIRTTSGYGIRFGGTANSIYGSNTSNVVAINTNGSERMRIDSSGNVGIGSTSPTFTTGSGLEIQRTAATATLRLEYTGSNGYEISAEQNQVTYNSVSSLPHVFEIGSAEKMRLDASGNVDVSGTVTTDGLTVENSSFPTVNINNASGTRVQLEYDTNNAVANLRTTVAAPLVFETNNTDRLHIAASGDISFYEDTGTTAKFFWDASDEKLTIDGNGTAVTSLATAASQSVLELNGNSTSGSDAIYFGATSSSGSNYLQVANATGTTAYDLLLNPYGGNVGIGVSSNLTGTLNLPNDGLVSFHDAGGNARNALQFSSGELKHGAAGAGLSTQTFYTSGTERLRIDSSGNTGFGTTSPQALVHLTDTSADVELRLTSAATDKNIIMFGDSTDQTGGAIKYDNASNYMSFETQNNIEAMRIDSSGNVGIGTTSPSDTLEVKASGDDDGIRLQGSGGANIAWLHQQSTDAATLRMYDGSDLNVLISSNANANSYFNTGGKVGIGTASPSAIIDARDTTGSLSATQDKTAEFGRYDGTSNPRLEVRHSTTGTDLNHSYSTGASNLTFSIIGTEIMRLDSSGNLLVGTTSFSTTTAGIKLDADGDIAANRDGQAAAFFGRLSSDGEIVRFRKDGTTVGSIGVDGGDLFVGNADAALLFADGVNAVLPWNASTPASNDNFVSLGNSSNRFKDLYLSSSVDLRNSTATSVDFTDTDTAPGVGKVLGEITWTDSHSSYGNTGVKVEGQYSSSGMHSFVLKTNDFSTPANLETRLVVNNSGFQIYDGAGSEAARVDSSGNLLVGTTSSFGGLINAPVTTSDEAMVTQSDSTSASTHLNFRNPNGFVGSISTSSTATAFNTSSDQRLKENIVDASSASDDIDAIQVRSFDWKADGSHQKYGMVAQELQTVAPEAVTQPDDPEEMMGVDYSKLVPMLIKEVQQLRARVAQLEGAN